MSFEVFANVLSERVAETAKVPALTPLASSSSASVMAPLSLSVSMAKEKLAIPGTLNSLFLTSSSLPPWTTRSRPESLLTKGFVSESAVFMFCTSTLSK